MHVASTFASRFRLYSVGFKRTRQFWRLKRTHIKDAARTFSHLERLELSDSLGMAIAIRIHGNLKNPMQCCQLPAI